MRKGYNKTCLIINCLLHLKGKTKTISRNYYENIFIIIALIVEKVNVRSTVGRCLGDILYKSDKFNIEHTHPPSSSYKNKKHE